MKFEILSFRAQVEGGLINYMVGRLVSSLVGWSFVSQLVGQLIGQSIDQIDWMMD